MGDKISIEKSMSLEKSIKRLTQVIQAATPAPARSPCETQYYPGHPAYCFCYKRANPTFAGECCYESFNKTTRKTNCYCLTYTADSEKPKSQNVDCVPKEFGIEDGPSFSPTTPVRN